MTYIPSHFVNSHRNIYLVHILRILLRTFLNTCVDRTRQLYVVTKYFHNDLHTPVYKHKN